MKCKVLVTGAAGLLGSNFTRYLLSEDYDVIGIDNFSGGYKENLAEGLKNYEVNLFDLPEVEKILKKEKPDYVYHFAAYAAEGLSPFIRSYNYKNNLICSTNLITASINNDVKKFIFTSSMAVYGENETPFRETMTPSPVDPYGIAKFAVEMDLKLAKEQFGLSYNIVRPHNVVGVYQNIWDKYRNVIGIWIRKAMNNEPLTIFGDGQQKRAFSDMKYYNVPFEKLMTNYDGEIFNLGSDKEFTILEAAQLVVKCAKNFGFNSSIEFLEQRHEVKNAFSNHAKAKKMLDFKDETNLENTINEMFEWAIKQPDRLVVNMEYETNKKIYDYWK